MKQKITNMLKTLFSDVRQASVPAILLLIFGGSAGLLLVSEKVLDFSIQLATTPTPLWVTIALALLFCSYTYWNTRKSLKTVPKENQSSHTPIEKQIEIKEKPDFIFHNNLLWLKNDSSPFCPVCYETNEKRIHVFSYHDSNNYEEWNYYQCHICEHHTEFSDHPLKVKIPF